MAMRAELFAPQQPFPLIVRSTPPGEIVPGCPQPFEATRFLNDCRLELLDEDGDLLAAIEQNPDGNTQEEKTYFLVFPDGTKILLAAPFLTELPDFSIDIHQRKNLAITITNPDLKFSYRFVRNLHSAVIQQNPPLGVEYEIGSEWKEFLPVEDEVLVFYDSSDHLLASVHKLSHSGEYILFDPQGREMMRFAEGEETDERKGRVSCGVVNGKFRIKCDVPFKMRIENNRVGPEWKEFLPADDQFIGLYDNGDHLLASVYKIPSLNEYILRDPQGDAIRHFVEGQEIALGGDGNKFFYAVLNGKFRTKCDVPHKVKIECVESSKRIPMGQDGLIEGVMHGGRRVAVGSFRELGKVKDGMEKVNDDNAGFNKDTLVVVDGLGGCINGHVAASYATETLLRQEGDLPTAINNTHNELVAGLTPFFDFVQREQIRRSIAKASSTASASASNSTPQTHQKEMRLPDGVAAVARFEGYKLKTMVLGDSVVYVIRGGRVAFRSREHSNVASWVRQGFITERQAMLRPDRNMIYTTLVSNFYPDYQEFDLQPGDIVLVVSDGGVMPDDVLVNCVQGQKIPRVAVEALMAAKTEENDPLPASQGLQPQPGGLYDPGDGGPLVRLVSWDNATFALTIID